MPIVFVHGVNVRQDSTYEAHVTQRNAHLRELLLRPLLPNPHPVALFNPYWGRYAASLAWGGLSLPTGPAQALDPLAGADPDQALVELLLSGNDTPLPGVANRTLATLAAASLPDAVDLLFALAANQTAVAQPSDELTDLLHLATRVYSYVEAHPKPAWLTPTLTDQAFITRLRAAVDQWQPPPAPTALSLTDTWAALHEGLDRFANLAGHYSSRALLAFTRQPLNTAVTHFIGDVFTYLAERGEAQSPGPIIQTIAAQLDQAVAARHPTRDPYLIVIAHSMGGNITYDLLTHFRPGAYPVDLLITVGSQVALMEELKLYKASDHAIPIDPRQQRVAKPPGVKHWLNVYDPNDVLSYAAEGVFDGVTDFVYTTGKHVIAAHTAYFQRGSFYRRLAVRIKELLQPGIVGA